MTFVDNDTSHDDNKSGIETKDDSILFDPEIYDNTPLQPSSSRVESLCRDNSEESVSSPEVGGNPMIIDSEASHDDDKLSIESKDGLNSSIPEICVEHPLQQCGVSESKMWLEGVFINKGEKKEVVIPRQDSFDKLKKLQENVDIGNRRKTKLKETIPGIETVEEVTCRN